MKAKQQISSLVLAVIKMGECHDLTEEMKAIVSAIYTRTQALEILVKEKEEDFANLPLLARLNVLSYRFEYDSIEARTLTEASDKLK